LRACILGIIPGDVTEAAVNRCKQTLESSDVPLTERVRKMVLLFDELGVKVEHLEKRLGHKLQAVIPQEIVTLTAVYKSIKDGMSTREDFFEIGQKENAVAKESLDTLLEDKKRKQTVNPDTGEIQPDGNTDKK